MNCHWSSTIEIICVLFLFFVCGHWNERKKTKQNIDLKKYIKISDIKQIEKGLLLVRIQNYKNTLNIGFSSE